MAQDGNKGAQDVGVRALAASLQCGKSKDATISEVGSRKELGAQMSTLIPGDMTSTFSSERVFIISMGSRPTAGYIISLAHTRAGLDRGLVTIPIIWNEPAQNAFTAQMITQPCLIVALEKRQYSSLRAVDQHGVERARLTLH